jgi:hypothetical protein
VNPYVIAFVVGGLIGAALGMGGLVAYFAVKWKWY